MQKSSLCIINLSNYPLINDDDVLSLTRLYDVSFMVLDQSLFVYPKCLPVKLETCNSITLDDYEVFVIPQNHPNDHQEYLYQLVDYAINKYKRVFSFIEIDRTKLNAKNNQSLLIDCFPNYSSVNIDDRNFLTNAPIIYICGNSINVSKNNINVLLKHGFERNGAKVISLSFNEYATILGQEKYPDAILDTTKDVGQRYKDFVNFLTEIDAQKHPDVYIMTVPNFENSTHCTGYFLPDVFRLLTPPDYLIFCLISHNYSYDEINMISELSINSKKVDCYYVSQNSFNLMPNRETKNNPYEIVRHSKDISTLVSNKLIKNGMTVFSDDVDAFNYAINDFYRKYYLPSNLIL